MAIGLCCDTVLKYDFFSAQTTCRARGMKNIFWLMHTDDDDDDHYADASPQKPPTKEVFCLFLKLIVVMQASGVVVLISISSARIALHDTADE